MKIAKLSMDLAVVRFDNPNFDWLMFNQLMGSGELFAAAEMTIGLDDPAADDLFRLAADKAIAQESVKHLVSMTDDIRMKRKLRYDQIQRIANLIALEPLRLRFAC